MPSDLNRYKADLEKLEGLGSQLSEWLRQDVAEFKVHYQAWYTEAMALIRFTLPDRLQSFMEHYEVSHRVMQMTALDYRICNYLQRIMFRGHGTDDCREMAISHFDQQLAMLRAVNSRFESSLFQIRQLTQADLFDSELDAAKGLLKMGFERAAGAVAGVVLEHHLKEVCTRHPEAASKLPKDPALAVLYDALKDAGVIEPHLWRFIQRLGDLRNLCSHKKAKDPTTEQVEEFIDGVDRVIKSVS